LALSCVASSLCAQALIEPIETSNRVAVRSAYNNYYVQPMPPMGWTGSIDTCDAGTISRAFQDWTITRVNFFRAMAGLPGNVALNATNSAKAQRAALMMAANDELSHFPPTDWACYSAEGAEAARNSNIAISFGPTSFDDVIPRYVDDEGLNNAPVGHRRWILFPPQTSMGVGSLPTSFGQYAGANALWVLSAFGTRPATPEGTPWPPRGFVPLALFPLSRRWSFSYPGADFSASTVTMSVNGASVPVSVTSRTDNGYGDNTIVWEPSFTVTKGAIYEVSITGVPVSGGPRSFAYTVIPFDPSDPYIANADFAGDGKADVLWRNSITGQNAIWQMNGATVSASALIATVADTGWRMVATGDFDGDGRTDIVWRHAVSGDNAVWLMNGSALVSAALLMPVGDPSWAIVGVGDFDGDGKSDLLWRNTSTGDNAIWLMNATSVANSALISGVPDSDWTVAGVADFSRDGKADILWRNSRTGDTAVWLMNGFAVSSAAVVQSVSLAWAVAGLGDYDGDGRADILWRHNTTGDNAIWLMNGVSRQSSALIDRVPDAGWAILGTGDYDGDGKADVLWRNAQTGDNAIWLMNGFATKHSALITAVPDAGWTIIRQ
jgi:hypothetical protein